MNDINKNIRSIRENSAFSQEVVADKMKITQSQYARFERGAIKTDLKMLEQFASVFDLTIIDVITWPHKYVDVHSLPGQDKVKASLTIELQHEKKEQVLKLVFGKNSYEIINK